MKNIIIIHKSELSFIPPIISQIRILSEEGYAVTVINEGITGFWKQYFKETNVKFFEIIPNNKNILTKVLSYIIFRIKVYKYLHQNNINYDNSILWIEGSQTVFALGKNLNKYRFILQISELHEDIKYQFNATQKVINNAKAVVLPEFNRALIYQSMHKIKVRPYILPNKPYFIPSNNELKAFVNDYSDYVKVFTSNKVILYQGIINRERDLTCFVHAIKSFNGEYKLVLMGKDCGLVEEYKKIDSNILHIDFIPAPYYLLMTSMCNIGIVMYKPECLNTIYCAPNKTFEYASFCKPLLGNNIPGLKIIEENKMGVIVDENIIDDIICAINDIKQNYSIYSKNSKQYFDNTDNKSVVRSIIEEANR